MTDQLPAVEILVGPGPAREYGILSHIQWLTDADVPNDGRWEGGVEFRPTGAPNEPLIRLANQEGSTSMPAASELPDYRTDILAAVLYHRRKFSTVHFTFEEIKAELVDLLQTRSQFALEFLLCEGVGSAPGFRTVATNLTTAGSEGSLNATIADLEAAWQEVASPDIKPTLHMPRFAYPFMDNGRIEKRDGSVYTHGGTPVVWGSGYRNLLPDSDPSDTLDPGLVAMYLTGPVVGLRSEVSTNPATMSESFDQEINEVTVLGEQTVVVTYNSTSALCAVAKVS